jgi:hypothetical protein
VVVPNLKVDSYALLTRPPLCPKTSFDLHVLSIPPAFILSQDQTLHFEFVALSLPKLSQIPKPSIIILTTRIGLIYSFKVLFFLGSVAVRCFSLFGTLLNIAILFWLVNYFDEKFFRGLVFSLCA